MKLNLKSKIYILVTLPCLGIISLIIIFFQKNYIEYVAANTAVECISYSTAVSKLIHQLQKERGFSMLFMGDKISLADLQNQQKAVDNKKEELKIFTLHKSIGTKFHNFTDIFEDDLRNARKITEEKQNPSVAIENFDKAIYQLILNNIFIAQTIEAFGEEKKLLSVSHLDIAKENVGKLRANITMILNTDLPLNLAQVSELSSLKSGMNENLDSPTLSITNQTKVSLNHFKQSKEWTKSLEIISHVLKNAEQGHFQQNPIFFLKTITMSIDQLGEVIFSEQKLITQAVIHKQNKILDNLIITLLLSISLIIFVIVLGSIATTLAMLISQTNE